MERHKPNLELLQGHQELIATEPSPQSVWELCTPTVLFRMCDPKSVSTCCALTAPSGSSCCLVCLVFFECLQGLLLFLLKSGDIFCDRRWTGHFRPCSQHDALCLVSSCMVRPRGAGPALIIAYSAPPSLLLICSALRTILGAAASK